RDWSSDVCSSDLLRVRLDARDVEFVEQLLGPSPHALHIDHAPSPGLAAEADVLGDGPVGKEAELLEDRGDPGPGGLDRVGEVDLAAVDEQPTRIATVHSGDDLPQRRLPRAVLPDQTVHRARPHLEVDAVEDLDAEELLADPGGDQHR